MRLTSATYSLKMQWVSSGSKPRSRESSSWWSSSLAEPAAIPSDRGVAHVPERATLPGLGSRIRR